MAHNCTDGDAQHRQQDHHTDLQTGVHDGHVPALHGIEDQPRHGQAHRDVEDVRADRRGDGHVPVALARHDHGGQHVWHGGARGDDGHAQDAVADAGRGPDDPAEPHHRPSEHGDPQDGHDEGERIVFPPAISSHIWHSEHQDEHYRNRQHPVYHVLLVPIFRRVEGQRLVVVLIVLLVLILVLYLLQLLVVLRVLGGGRGRVRHRRHDVGELHLLAVGHGHVLRHRLRHRHRHDVRVLLARGQHDVAAAARGARVQVLDSVGLRGGPHAMVPELLVGVANGDRGAAPHESVLLFRWGCRVVMLLPGIASARSGTHIYILRLVAG
mmetsp:Transcript_45480/g.131678  ORF Transcript_45480/g.131678 Transcript_45480/m.131678 type:complete len:325 (+) Transcript_45480:341-1315(+)